MTSILDTKAASLVSFQDALDKALDQGRAAYDRIFEDPPEGLSVHEIDLEHVLVRVSRAHEKLLGYPAERMVGKPASTFVILQETSERAMGQKLSGTRQLKPFIRAFKKADGSSCTMLLLDRHVRDGAGTVIGMRTVLTNIPPDAVLGP